jgi:acetolactate synthase-1/2/3 large subunit
MKNTDVLAEVLLEAGIEDFFAVTGGAAVHIIDSLVRHAEIRAIFHHHEQAASLAADAYARLKNLGVCVVTTGPGVTNAITGLLCSWQDSVPTIFISGQARHALTALGSPVRQVGTQHLEVIPLVKHLTKKAVMLQPGDDIRDVIIELIDLSQSGRKGPVWLDIPLDLQIQEYKGQMHKKEKSNSYQSNKIPHQMLEEMQLDFSKSTRPVMLLGRGIAGLDQEEFNRSVQKLGIPCVRTWGFLDTNLTIPKEFDLGVVGVSGQRGANKLISQSDFVVSLGARWGQAVVGPLINEFAPRAIIHIADIDEHELSRVNTTLPNAKTLHADAKGILVAISDAFLENLASDEWLVYSQSLKEFNSEQKSIVSNDGIDQYALFDLLDRSIDQESTIVVDGGGTIVYCSMQVLNLRSLRKIVIPSASAPMGTGIPHAIGAQVALPNWKTILICGDGSFPFNLQELQTLVTNYLPIKMIIVNNNGYLSIQGTQDQFLEGRQYGSSKQGGLEVPDFRRITSAFDIEYSEVRKQSDLESQIKRLLESKAPAVLEVFIKENQEIYPRTGFSKNSQGKFEPLPLSEMYPRVKIANFSKDS